MENITVYQTHFKVGSFTKSVLLRDIVNDIARNEKRYWSVIGVGAHSTSINYTDDSVLSYLALKYDEVIERTLTISVPYAKFVSGNFHF